MTKRHPICAWLFWTRSDGLADRVICRVTGGGPWSHMGIGFNMSDGDSVYYEAHWSHKRFAGPFCAIKLQRWEVADNGRAVGVRHLHLSDNALRLVYRRTEVMAAKQLGYNLWQLVQIWGMERLGIRVKRSPRKVICSEAVSRILEHVLDLRGNRSHDEVTPNSAFEQYSILLGRE